MGTRTTKILVSRLIFEMRQLIRAAAKVLLTCCAPKL